MVNIVRTLIASISQEISVRMFLNITDPKKRDEIVADYIATIRKIKERNENEKLVGLSRTAELEQTYQPIIQSQEASAEKISQAISQQDKSDKLIYEEGSQIDKLIMRYKMNDNVDSTYGIKFTDHGAFIGKTSVSFDGDDIIIEGQSYEGTPALWTLITERTEKRINAMTDDMTDEDWLILIYLEDSDAKKGKIVVENKTNPEKHETKSFQAKDIFTYSDYLVDAMTAHIDRERQKKAS